MRLDVEVGFGVLVAIRVVTGVVCEICFDVAICDVAGVVCMICVVRSMRGAESRCVVVCEGAAVCSSCMVVAVAPGGICDVVSVATFGASSAVDEIDIAALLAAM